MPSETADPSRDLDRAAEMVAGARSIAVLTGAGVSAESGVPTFRGAQGLWKGRRPEEVATPEAFARDPEEVWELYRWRRELLEPLEPNAGHRVLARWEARLPLLRLVTQNVDGLHAAAGSSNVIELHGSLWVLRCTGCGEQSTRRDRITASVPHCDGCGAPLRPGVVWFGEALSPEALESAVEASRSCDLFLCIGTSSLVHPAAALPWLALRAGAGVIEINPQPTPLSPDATQCLRGPAGEILAALDERLP